MDQLDKLFSRFFCDGPKVEELIYWGEPDGGKKCAKKASVTATVAPAETIVLRSAQRVGHILLRGKKD
jgi:hypothetical protein